LTRINNAIAAYTAILAHTPRQPDALYMLAALSFKLGQGDFALSFVQTLLHDQPDHIDALALQAMIYRTHYRFDEAAASARRVLALDAQREDIWVLIAKILIQDAQFSDAIAHIEQAIALFPAKGRLRACYALALAATGRPQQGYGQASAAEKINPDDADAVMAVIITLSACGHYDRALARCQAAMANYQQLAKPLAFIAASALLIQGKYAEGYEAMYQANIGRDDVSPVPRWTGAACDQHVVLYSEQGFGDLFQFVRFVPRVAALAGAVTLRVPARVERLLRASMPDVNLSLYHPPTTTVRRAAERGNQPDPMLDFPTDIDARVSLLNLPHLLELGSGTDADLVPYLKVDPELKALWAQKLASIPHPRIGISWVGSPQNGNDSNRSMTFDTLQPLIAAFGQHIVSLQMGLAAQQLAEGIYDTAPLTRDFADTAAAIANLDLVISVDTSLAHLAGAMGVPVWVMLAFDPDWRWLLKRGDSPWYPTARLFRQSQAGQWGDVVDRICDELHKIHIVE